MEIAENQVGIFLIDVFLSLILLRVARNNETMVKQSAIRKASHTPIPQKALSPLPTNNPIPRRPFPNRVPIAAILMQIEVRAIAYGIIVISENKQRGHIGMTHECFAQSFDAVIGVHAIGHVAGAVESGRNGD